MFVWKEMFPFYQQKIIPKSLIGYPFRVQHISFESEAIYTGSAVVVNGAGPNGAPGIVQIYPGQRWEMFAGGFSLPWCIYHPIYYNYCIL